MFMFSATETTCKQSATETLQPRCHRPCQLDCADLIEHNYGLKIINSDDGIFH